jgi:RNA-directed DNA polymerase
LRLDDEIIEMWSARDALALKALTMVLSKHLDPFLSGRCYHVAGRGGAKAAVRGAIEASSGDVHLMKSDIKDYYAIMDHIVLFELVERHVKDLMVLRLVWGYLKRTVCFGENYREVTRGISLGCLISPLMGSLYLHEAKDQRGWFYIRFMDWIIITSGRWKLRQAVSCVNQLLRVLQVEKHPDNTFIGKACRGFDFLGYYFISETISVSRPALRRFAERITRLYEQGTDNIRVGQYVRRWWGWVRAGVPNSALPRWATYHFLVPLPTGVLA